MIEDKIEHIRKTYTIDGKPEVVYPTPLNLEHPKANWAIWHPNIARYEPFHKRLAAFITTSASGYVNHHGSWAVFEHHEDAVLWIVFR